MTVDAGAVIPTLNGDLFALDLAAMEDPVFVYTWDGQKVTIGRILVEPSYLTVPVHLELDDGSDFHVSDQTQVLLRSGERTTAGALTPATSLLPLYYKADSDGYSIYREPGDWNKSALTKRDSWNWRRVSRMVAEWKLGRRCQPGDIVRFVDGNKKNAHPENLLVEFREPKPIKRKIKFVEPLLEAQKFLDDENHKVESVQIGVSREMFSITGLKIDNLCVGGVFISVDETA